MTLSQFFAALQNGNKVLVTIKENGAENTVTELTKVYASGYAQLLTTLLAREISTVTINNQNDVVVVLTASA